MKTLLKGGPLNGKIINATRNQFAYGEVEDKLKVLAPGEYRLASRREVKYENSHSRERHPAKQRGLIRVFTFAGVSKWKKTSKKRRAA